MDVRTHIYASYTSAQTRISNVDGIRQHAQAQFDALRTTILPHLPVNKSAAILDAGCGYGALLLLLKNEGYTNVHGIDISSEQVATAHALGLNDVVCGDLLDSGLLQKHWDVVIMLDVIEHLRRSEALAALHAIHEALVPGGVFLARTPNVDGLMGTVLSFGDVTHEMHLNPLSAKELMAATPFTDVGVVGIPPTGGSALVRFLRAVVTPIVVLAHRAVALAAGVATSMTLFTANMLVVARKNGRN